MSRTTNRAQHRHPGSRPPGRHDSRRPAGTPPRGPATAATWTAVPEDRPPGSSPRPVQRRTRPQDTRPPGAPGGTPTTGRTADPDRTRTARTATPARTRTARGTAPAVPATTPTAPTAAPTARGTTPTARRTAPAVHGTAPGRRAAGGRQGALPTPAAVSWPSTPVAPARTPLVPPRTARPAVPQPRPADLFAERLLAVLSGRSPVHSMLRHTVGQAYDELARLAERGPLRTRGTRPVVRDIGWFEPRPGAVEVFARIGAGDQLRAMAFRLERGPDLRWRCTAVELGGPRPPREDLH
nr:Rv3235 family protein [Streptomyces sp. ISL-12]